MGFSVFIISKHTLDVLLRCTAGIFVGYALSSFFSIVFAKVLVIGWSLPLGDSVLIATMLGHTFYFIFLILCFCPFTHRQIWFTAVFILVFLTLLHNLIPVP